MSEQRVVPMLAYEDAGRIKLHVDGEMPELVMLDPYRVEQILRNLLHNALKFSPEGSEVELEVGFTLAGVELSVTDHGIGIPPDEQIQVFERFHQAQDSLTRQTEGAGLGLYITKRLVEAMDGTIGLRSEPGYGSTFTVSIPTPEPKGLTVPETEIVRR